MQSFDIEEEHSLIMEIDFSLCPWALFGSNALVNFIIAPVQKSKVGSLFSFWKIRFVDRELFLTIVLHCLLKKLLNKFDFAEKSVTSR